MCSEINSDQRGGRRNEFWEWLFSGNYLDHWRNLTFGEACDKAEALFLRVR